MRPNDQGQEKMGEPVRQNKAEKQDLHCPEDERSDGDRPNKFHVV